MSRFLDGPARSKILMLQRAPLMLRAVVGPAGVDALDQPDDSPKPEEAVHVYLRVGRTHPVMVDFRGKDGRRRGECRLGATYRLYPEQPGPEHTRTGEAWKAWCNANLPRINELATAAAAGESDWTEILDEVAKEQQQEGAQG